MINILKGLKLKDLIVCLFQCVVFIVPVMCLWNPVHTSPKRVKNGAKMSQNTVAFTQYRIEIVWKRHPNRSDLKTISKRCDMKTEHWRCGVNTKFFTFWLHFSAQPPSYQNSNLNCFLCYFLCPIWKVRGLSGLLLTCRQILTASCEHMEIIFSCNAVWSITNG